MMGTATMNGGAKISFTGRSGYGVRVGSGVMVANITETTITGGGATGTGVIMESAQTMELNKVTIEGVGKGVNASKGKVDMMGGTVTFTGGNGNWGVQVGRGATANLMRATIKGTNGQGTGLYVMGTATMNGGEISNVESGVYATGAGTLTINGEAKITVKGGAESYGVKVMGTGSATLTNMTIEGTSGGTGKGVEVSMGSSKTMTMT
ncbi:hypothetical protein, partial [Bartonella bovis]|uniref:hypothetical protein n=1 Tax=Bartonella bovis TaxID=155194 RepID=UPI003CC7D63A